MSARRWPSHSPHVARGGSAASAEICGIATSPRCLRSRIWRSTTAARNVVVLQLGAPEFQLRAEPAETPLPALAIADHRRVDQQALPSPRRAQSAFDHRHRIGREVCDLAAGSCGGRGVFGLRGRRGAGEFEVRCDEAPRPVAIRVGHLRERKILGVAARREMLGGAGQQREQSAAAGLGPGGAAREAGRNRGAIERFFQIRHVTSRRMQRDRDTIEANAAVRLGKNPARDLDAFLHLARRRDDFDGIVERALGRRLVAEEIILQPRDRFRRRFRGTWRGLRREPSAAPSIVSVVVSPCGTVASIAGARAASAAYSSHSSVEVTATSSIRIGIVAWRGGGSALTIAAANVSIAARSTRRAS